MPGIPRVIVVASFLLPAACSRTQEAPAPIVGETVLVVEPRERTIAPDADAPLRAMSDYLAGLEQFTVHTAGSVEAVLTDGQTLSFPYESRVWVRRPAGLRTDRVTENDQLQFFYDGRTFTLHGRRSGFYAQLAAPDTLDKAIAAMSEKLDLDAPGADLLDDDPYATLVVLRKSPGHADASQGSRGVVVAVLYKRGACVRREVRVSGFPCSRNLRIPLG